MNWSGLQSVVDRGLLLPYGRVSIYLLLCVRAKSLCTESTLVRFKVKLFQVPDKKI